MIGGEPRARDSRLRLRPPAVPGAARVAVATEDTVTQFPTYAEAYLEAIERLAL